MSKFEIHDQVKLSLGKCVELVLSGVQFRLFRASITVAIVALAVAFLMAILGDSLIGRKVGESLSEMTKPRRVFLAWVHRLSARMGEADVSQVLVSAAPGDMRWEEFKTWGGLDDGAMGNLKRIALREDAYLKWFENTRESDRRRLAGRAMGRGILEHLQAADAMANFQAVHQGMTERMAASLDDFRSFLAEWSGGRATVHRIIDRHDEERRAASGQFGRDSAQAILAGMDEGKRAILTAHGFRMTDEDVKIVREQAAASLQARKVERLLQNTMVKQRVANRYGLKDLNKVSATILFDKMSRLGEAKWLVGLLAEIGVACDLTAEQLRDIAGQQVRDRELAAIEAGLGSVRSEKGWLGFSNRVLWLIVVSLIVCAVGIANAMLMSVTERFKEIATMKCLGATDGFIMINFLLESGIQGFAGGVVGGVLGLILGVLRSAGSYGTLVFLNLPGAEMAVSIAGSLCAGVLLSIFAAIYPAWVAARLAPLEAMRVE